MDEEVLQLFGAPSGSIGQCTLDVRTVRTYVANSVVLTIRFAMRKDPLVMSVKLNDGQSFDKPIGVFAALMLKAQYVTDIKYMKAKCLANSRVLEQYGFEVDLYGFGGRR